MSRYRDNKGRFIAPKISEKLEKKTIKKPPPYTNSSKTRVGKILRGESSKESIETTTKGTRSKAIVQITNRRQKEKETTLATPSRRETRKEAKVIIEEAAFVVGRPHKTLEKPEIPENLVVEPSLSGENSPPPYKVLKNMVEKEGNLANEIETFGFPVLDMAKDVAMKNIPLSSLLHFRGMSTEDPDSFLFEFDILCRRYNYIDNAKKLKLFPATLKYSALRWFMSLGEHIILSWDGMKENFLQKYQDY
jgi:hypothetical protein